MRAIRTQDDRDYDKVLYLLPMSCVDGSRVASGDLMFGVGRVQSCVRPVDAVTDRWP